MTSFIERSIELVETALQGICGFSGFGVVYAALAGSIQGVQVSLLILFISGFCWYAGFHYDGHEETL